MQKIISFIIRIFNIKNKYNNKPLGESKVISKGEKYILYETKFYDKNLFNERKKSYDNEFKMNFNLPKNPKTMTEEEASDKATLIVWFLIIISTGVFACLTYFILSRFIYV